MELLGGILVIAVLIAAWWVVDKVGGLAQVGANRVVFRGEYTAGRHLREGLTIRTSASVADVMRELDTYVSALDAATGLSDVLFTRARTDRGIAWVYGHGSKVLLEAIVAMRACGDGTDAVFAVTRWEEEDGLIEAMEALKSLRMQVEAAFRAADPGVAMTGGEVSQAYVEQFQGAFETTQA